MLVWSLCYLLGSKNLVGSAFAVEIAIRPDFRKFRREFEFGPSPSAPLLLETRLSFLFTARSRPKEFELRDERVARIVIPGEHGASK